MSNAPSAPHPLRFRAGTRRQAASASRTRTQASRGRRGARARPAPARGPHFSSSPPSSLACLPPKQKPSPDHGTRARGATRSWPAIAGGPSASAVTERPLLTEGFRASLLLVQDAVSRDPFAPLPPPGLTPLPGSLSVLRGLIAPARATFAQDCNTGGRRSEHPAFGLKRAPLD